MPAVPPIVPLTAPGPATLEAVLAEIRAVRALQEQILGRWAGAPPTFASAPAPSPSAAFGLGGDDDEAPRPAPAAVRARRRKTVLLIDDDPASTQEAKAALDAAEVPVRTVNDGNAALGAIAAEKPDVIVIEQEMGGAMAGKDVINMIKATMEWVDIPIVLYTRANVTSQKEARTIHGADEVVLKTERAPALVSRVIAIFRKA
jgi:CheY-like chemotaxis protein